MDFGADLLSTMATSPLPQDQPKLTSVQSQPPLNQPEPATLGGDDFEFDDFDMTPSKQQAQKLTFTACDNEHLSVEFNCTKVGNKTDIKALYNNKTGFMIEDITVKIMAAKHLTMNMMPLNVDEMSPEAQGEMQQVSFYR